MTKEQYETQLKIAKTSYDLSVKAAQKVYAFSNNFYAKGDKVTDHIGSIIIESIGVYYSKDNPYCLYTGRNLLKSGQVSKREPMRTIHQCNIKK